MLSSIPSLILLQRLKKECRISSSLDIALERHGFSHLYVFFGVMSIQVFRPFFDWVVVFFVVVIELYKLFVYFGN